METWSRAIALSVGGVLGVNARYWLGYWISKWGSSHFPWATFAINVSGSFAIGFFTVALARWLPHPNVRLFVITGFLGGYTTFSTFAYESVTLWERGELVLALANMTGSVVAGFAAVFLGIGFAHGVLPSTLVHSPRTVRQTGVSGVEPATPFLVVASETTPLEAESVPSTTGDFQGVNPLPDARNGRLP